MKICNKCKENKTFDCFSKNPTRFNPNHLRSQCKLCDELTRKQHYKANKDKIIARTAKYARLNPDKRRGYKLKLRYAIGIQVYNELLKKQNGLCAICKTDNPTTKNKKTFCIDHDHITGKIRGLLCDNCNKALGNLKDNIENLEAAIRYLKNGKI